MKNYAWIIIFLLALALLIFVPAKMTSCIVNSNMPIWLKIMLLK